MIKKLDELDELDKEFMNHFLPSGIYGKAIRIYDFNSEALQQLIIEEYVPFFVKLKELARRSEKL